MSNPETDFISLCPECHAAGKVVPLLLAPSGEQTCVHNRLRFAFKDLLDARRSGTEQEAFAAEGMVLCYAHEFYAQVFKPKAGEPG